MEYHTFNITIGSVVSLCWQNLTLRVIMDLLWSLSHILCAISLTIEKGFWLFIYLLFAYVDRVIAYTMTEVIGYNTTTNLLLNASSSS
jgi:hypothetical protein